jgi:hypothetical protein
MEQNYVVLGAIVVGLMVVGLVLWALTRGRRHKELASRFGPEYDRTVTEMGKRSAAEKELEARAKRVEKLHIHALSPEDRARFRELWRSAQAIFVDNPLTAVVAADKLVAEVMRLRGYPMAEFEQRAADLSVDYPRLVQDYRAARAIADRNDRSEADTEDLRQALVHYRSLFEELLEVGEDPKAGDSADHSVEEAR